MFLCKFLIFFTAHLYLIIKLRLNSMMQRTHKSYQPTESTKDFGRFIASVDNWAIVLGTWRVEEIDG